MASLKRKKNRWGAALIAESRDSVPAQSNHSHIPEASTHSSRDL